MLCSIPAVLRAQTRNLGRSGFPQGAGLLFVFTRVQLASSCSWWNVACIAPSTTSLGSDMQRLWIAHLAILPAPFVLGLH
ncbi:hypothetical protein Taro_055670 [Colocasia esculenta]|uniref:Uncharacterized protein n=1 Tax=Colocasia esculenta TaxID=4460 RepID=A0A843XUZ1_COLES|nr:hypothetical protein [Colocasia esculenta]